MDALASPAPQPVCAVAVRLADEGIPVRAIARATNIPASEVYELLRAAIAAGTIIELPKDDWPPGTPRTSRTLCSRGSTDKSLALACARFFRATRLEAALLSVLLKRSEVTKQQLHLVIEQNRPSEGRVETDPKMVDVIICHLRKKLKPHGLAITTIWGIGYLMSAEHRERASVLLDQFNTSASGGADSGRPVS